jgi:hypothetical protein
MILQTLVEYLRHSMCNGRRDIPSGVLYSQCVLCAESSKTGELVGIMPLKEMVERGKKQVKYRAK